MSRPTIEERFWSKVDKSGSCWLWQAATNSRGYGRFGIGSRTVKAHRFAYELVNGPIPEGLHILHSCDHPGCVRPDHLRAGTHQENMADMVSKGRQAKGETIAKHTRGSKQGLAKLTEADVVTIKELLNSKQHSQRDIAKLFGVKHNTISGINTGKYWSHVLSTAPIRPMNESKAFNHKHTHRVRRTAP